MLGAVPVAVVLAATAAAAAAADDDDDGLCAVLFDDDFNDFDVAVVPFVVVAVVVVCDFLSWLLVRLDLVLLGRVLPLSRVPADECSLCLERLE